MLCNLPPREICGVHSEAGLLRARGAAARPPAKAELGVAVDGERPGRVGGVEVLGVAVEELTCFCFF